MNGQSAILSGGGINNYSQAQIQTNTSIQYPSLELVIPTKNIIQQATNQNYYAKPQVQTNTYVTNQTYPATTQQTYYQPTITTVPTTQIVQPTPYVGVPTTPKKTIINTH